VGESLHIGVAGACSRFQSGGLPLRNMYGAFLITEKGFTSLHLRGNLFPR
jgi:hypothetical protein